jgi:MFS family permease
MRVRDYRRVFLANAASFVGDQIVPVALAFAVLEATGSATALGLVLLSRTVPLAVFVLTGGVWADRIPRQWIMFGSDVVRAVSQGAFAAVLLTGHATLVTMMVLQAVHGAASAFYRPASSGLLAQLLPAGLRQQGTALMYSMASAAGILGPVIAGVMLAVSSPAWVLAIDAVSFAVSALLLTGVRPPPRTPAPRQRFVRELADGWHEVVSRPWLRSWIGNFALFQFTVLAAFMVLGPVVSERSLGGETTWAIMSACVGAGSLLGSVVAVRWRPHRPLLAVAVTLLLSPAVLLGLAAAAPLYVLAALAVVFGTVITFADAVWEGTVQTHVPEHVLSRVVSYDWLGSTVLRPIGLAVLGPIAAALGAGSTLVTVSLLYFAATVVALLAPATRALRAPTRTDTEPVTTV